MDNGAERFLMPKFCRFDKRARLSLLGAGDGLMRSSFMRKKQHIEMFWVQFSWRCARFFLIHVVHVFCLKSCAVRLQEAKRTERCRSCFELSFYRRTWIFKHLFNNHMTANNSNNNDNNNLISPQ